MPYKTGKLKGQLTSTELRRLVKEHNKLYSIKIPKGASYEEIIQLIKDNGYNVDHKNQRLTLAMKKLERVIKLPPPPVPKTKEEIAKAKKEKEGKANVKDTEAYKKRKDQIEKLKKLKESRDKSKQVKVNKYITTPFKMKKDYNELINEPHVKNHYRKMKDKDEELMKKFFDPTSSFMKNKRGVDMKIFKPDKNATSPVNIEIIFEMLDTTDNKFKGSSFMWKIERRPDPLLKLKQPVPKPVKIDDSKKPPSNTMKIDDTNKWKLIPVKSIDATNPLTKKDYEDIRDIPAEEIFKNIEANKEVDFYPWTSYFASAIFTYTYILKENNNDCSLPLDLLDKIGKEKNTTNKKITNPNSNLKKYAKEIAESIIRCWKKGQVVCIPISIVQGGKKKNTHSYHANMLVFNSYRMEAEHFEPHGRFFEGQGKYVKNKEGTHKVWRYNVVQGINFKPAVTEINKEIKNLLKTTPTFTNINELKKGFVYKSPLDICPPKSQYESFKGFQQHDRYRDNKTRQFNGVVITEQGGYCAMWSLFYLATRLKTLKSPTTEITEKLNNMFMTKYGENTPEGDTRKKMVELMRGMSKFSFEKNMEMVSKGLITKEELIAFMGIKKGYNPTLYTKYNNAMKEFTKGEWATFTS